jgi:predicted nucleotidyltransferase
VPEGGGPFSPVELLGVLVGQGVDFILIGGLGATVHGSPYATVDVDIVPRQDRLNLDHLSNALRALGARVYVSAEKTLRFEHDGSSLADAAVWNLATAFGGLDITYVPAGTTGYSDLAERAQSIDVGGVVVRVAALEDIIRSKEAANREKDRVVLPALRRLLERTREQSLNRAHDHQP